MNDSLSKLAAVVTEWCFNQPLIVRAFIYGSRATGRNHQESDLDIALVISKLPGDSNSYTTWSFEGEKLKNSLQLLLPVEAHLEWYGGAAETPAVHSGLLNGCFLIFDKAPLETASQ